MSSLPKEVGHGVWNVLVYQKEHRGTNALASMPQPSLLFVDEGRLYIISL